jgi:hypothetical protein
MANETTYSLISSLVPIIWESAMWYAQHRFTMPGRVTAFTDATGIAPRKFSDYRETGNAAAIAETVEVPITALSRQLLTTFNPSEVAKRHRITDIRAETDTENVAADAARDLGYALGRKMEEDLVSNFASFTGGTTGGSSDFTIAKIFAARAILEASGVPGPYTVVLHPYHYLDVFSLFLDSTKPAAMAMRDQALKSYNLPGIADVEIVVSSLVPRLLVYTHTINGTGGTFAIKDNITGVTTSAIAYNANAATQQAALVAAFGAGSYVVTGTGPFVYTAQAAVGGPVSNGHDLRLDQALITGGVNTFVETSASAYSALFTRDALAIDLRRGMRLEAERAATFRATDLVATMVYAHGLLRSDRGVRILADATTPAT